MIWYLATCADCTPQLPQPFTDREERNRWAIAHNEATDHAVLLHQDAQL